MAIGKFIFTDKDNLFMIILYLLLITKKRTKHHLREMISIKSSNQETVE